MTLRRLCVFCGANRGGKPDYVEAAVRLGRELVARRIGLVYGGASVGIMGAIADAVLERGGEAIGVIPQTLMTREIVHRGLTQLQVVGSMHERKAMMAGLADGFIALPGGIGTLEEFFEVWTWSQLGLHAKPVALLDVAGYYAPLIRFLDNAVEQGFLAPRHRALLVADDTPGTLLERLAAWQPPEGAPKWLDPSST